VPGPATAYAGPQQPGGPARRSPHGTPPPPAEPPRSGRRRAPEPPADAPVTAVPADLSTLPAAPGTGVPSNAQVTAVPFDRLAAPRRRRTHDEPPADAPVTAVPASAPPSPRHPVSAPPVSAPPVSGPPTSAPPAAPPGETTVPVADLPVSAPPATRPPHTGELASVRDASTVDDEPISVPPADDVAPTSAPPEPSGPDPEQILATYEWVFDSETLREVVEDREGLEEVRDMLTAKINERTDNAARARLLSLRAVVSRILGDLHSALADAKIALAHAEATGELRRIAICQARLAHVLQWRGEYAEADRLFAEANSTELPDRLRGTMHQHAGKCAYDQGRYIEACNHFEKALDLRKQEDPDLMAATELALDAVFRQVMFNGWGPYPRTIEEIKQISRPPSPAMDDSTGLWGFTDAEGETKIEAHYADIQPFRDGVAWVRRPEHETWELIDESSETLIPAKRGYLGVSSFAGGLAWVSRDGNGSWIAIDKSNTVTISTGFDDVRPFRRGIAAVRRGGRWGAVDGVGRVVVPFQYDLFSTALSDGRYIDGFSDEGLAVVQLRGRKGVVDRSGRTLVDPAFTSLVIHPVAFLITDDGGRWGALDRKGRILIDPTHQTRVSVSEEIDRLLADARPVL